jgi:hypothetical protein
MHTRAHALLALSTHLVWAASPRPGREEKVLAPLTKAPEQLCGVATVVVSPEPFCKVEYPIKEFEDDSWVLYQDASARAYFEGEYIKKGDASPVCLAATKSLICSRYFPRCDTAEDFAPRTEPSTNGWEKILLPCQSICNQLHENACAGAVHQDCNLTGCDPNDPDAGDKCFSTSRCTEYPSSPLDFVSSTSSLKTMARPKFKDDGPREGGGMFASSFGTTSDGEKLTEFCKEGLTNYQGDVCCPSSCSQCGGGGCMENNGGSSDCCIDQIHASSRACSSESDVKCIMPTSCAEDKCLLECPYNKGCEAVWRRRGWAAEAGQPLHGVDEPIKATSPSQLKRSRCVRETFTDMNSWYKDVPRQAQETDCHFMCDHPDRKQWCEGYEFSAKDNGSCKLSDGCSAKESVHMKKPDEKEHFEEQNRAEASRREGAKPLPGNGCVSHGAKCCQTLKGEDFCAGELVCRDSGGTRMCILPARPATIRFGSAVRRLFPQRNLIKVF